MDSQLFDVRTLNILTIALCLSYSLFSFVSSKKSKHSAADILLLPSVLIPCIIVIIFCIPVIWHFNDPTYRISYLQRNYFDQTMLLVFSSTFVTLLGMAAGRIGLQKNHYYYDFSQHGYWVIKTNLRRTLDKMFYGELGRKSCWIIAFIAAVIFPFTFALRLDLIFSEGIRRLTIESQELSRLVPFARVILSICTILSGVASAYQPNRKIIFIPLLLDVLQNLMKLSRGFFLPFLLFFFASSLTGKKYPKSAIVLTPILSIFFGVFAIAARGIGARGVGGIVAGTQQSLDNLAESVKVFFQANSMIGIISVPVSLHDVYQSGFLNGFIAWLISLSPLPTYFRATGTSLSVARLLGVTHAGIPMPALGEIYFRMGWLGLIVLLPFGYFLGSLERNILRHKYIFGTAYWPHVLLWISALSGFIFSMHSTSRAATRLLIYSFILLFSLELISSLKEKFKSS